MTPGWCKRFTLNAPYVMDRGYAYIDIAEECELQLHMNMPVRVVRANRQIHENAGRVAVMRGPVVYCIEGVDNGENLKTVAIDPKGVFTLGDSQFLLPSIMTTGYRPCAAEELYTDTEETMEEIPLKMIPYYAFANRGETEMQVWLLKK